MGMIIGKNVSDANIVIAYGGVKGNISNCKDVIIINGDIKGNINNCENVCGLLADDEKLQKSRILEKWRGDKDLSDSDKIFIMTHSQHDALVIDPMFRAIEEWMLKKYPDLDY